MNAKLERLQHKNIPINADVREILINDWDY